MEIADPVVACIADLAFKSAGSPKSAPHFVVFAFVTDCAHYFIIHPINFSPSLGVE